MTAPTTEGIEIVSNNNIEFTDAETNVNDAENPRAAGDDDIPAHAHVRGSWKKWFLAGVVAVGITAAVVLLAGGVTSKSPSSVQASKTITTAYDP